MIPRELPFAKSNYLIRVFRHALSLDEHRAKFKANQWGRSTEEEEKLGDAGKRAKYHRAKTPGGAIWSYVTGAHAGEHEEIVQKPSPKKDASHHRGEDWTVTLDKDKQTDVKGTSPSLPILSPINV